jgi:hypothetical protein
VNKKRLVLHIGVHKTGSTSVQNALAANAGLLARHGILYPKYPGAPAQVTNHNRLAWEIAEGVIDIAKLREWAESLAQKDARTLIISAEEFCKLKSLEFLACFQEHFEIEVVLYLRRQDSWINSWYNQNVKWPYLRELSGCTPTEFLAHLQEFFWIDYFETVERWAQAVGKDRIHVRVLERGQIEDPLADMCDICGVNFVLKRTQEKRANESLPATQLKILQDIGIMRYKPAVRLKIIRAVSEIPVTTTKEIYPAPLRRMILRRYAAGNAMLAERYLGRSDGILFRDEQIPDNPEGRENPVQNEHLYRFARNLIEVFAANASVVAPPKPPSPSGAV